jgi:hypothetical protein
MPWLHFSSRKGPPVPTAQEAGWAPELVWTRRLEEKSFASAAIKPRSPGNPVCSQTLYWLSDPGSQIKMHHLQEERYEHFLGLALQVCFATSFSSLWWWKQYVSLKCQVYFHETTWHYIPDICDLQNKLHLLSFAPDDSSATTIQLLTNY